MLDSFKLKDVLPSKKRKGKKPNHFGGKGLFEQDLDWPPEVGSKKQQQQRHQPQRVKIPLDLIGGPTIKAKKRKNLVNTKEDVMELENAYF